MSSLGSKKVFANNLKYYLELNNKSRVEVCSALGIRYSTFSEWMTGKKYPRIDKIEMLANYFGIKKSDLIESHNNNNDLAKLQYNILFEKYKLLNDLGKQKADDYINDLADNPKYVEKPKTVSLQMHKTSDNAEDTITLPIVARGGKAKPVTLSRKEYEEANKKHQDLFNDNDTSIIPLDED